MPLLLTRKTGYCFSSVESIISMGNYLILSQRGFHALDRAGLYLCWSSAWYNQFTALPTIRHGVFVGDRCVSP